jgi:hypothetical protein
MTAVHDLMVQIACERQREWLAGESYSPLDTQFDGVH